MAGQQTIIVMTEELLDAYLEKALDRVGGKLIETAKESARAERPKPVKGIKGICDLLHVSVSTANLYKDTFLAPAVHQVGKVILTDPVLAWELFKKHKPSLAEERENFIKKTG